MSRISLLLNLALFAGLIFLWAEKRNAASETSTPVQVTVSPSATAAPAVIAETAPRVEPLPFRWSQLESPDYRTYIINLRGIGCPEATLRAIVTDDLNIVYRKRSGELVQKLDALISRPLVVQFNSFNEQQAIKAELSKLPGEEYAEICDFLGLKPAPGQVATALPAVQPEEPSPELPVTMPLVFQNIDPATLGLSEEQNQMIANLRQDFLKQVGGLSQDASDPAYRTRWQQAQPNADNMLQAVVGNEVYTKFQLLADQAIVADQATPKNYAVTPR